MAECRRCGASFEKSKFAPRHYYCSRRCQEAVRDAKRDKRTGRMEAKKAAAAAWRARVASEGRCPRCGRPNSDAPYTITCAACSQGLWRVLGRIARGE